MTSTIRAIKFHHDLPKSGIRTILRVNSQNLLVQSLHSESSTVFVIADSSVDRLVVFGDLIKDLGLQNKAVALYRYFYQRPKIPIVKAKYRNFGNIARGIHQFLKYTYKNSQQKAKASILVIRQNQFEMLWRNTCGNNKEKAETTAQLHHSTYSIIEDIKNRKHIDENKLTMLAGKFVGNSEAAQKVRLDILIAAGHNHPVLIVGETGTGKNIVARAIHENSIPPKKNICTINCGAISSELVNSELFGHRKGAFTGATKNRKGLIQSADEGTLFLDEIGDMPLDQQVKMLHVLEDGRYRRVGEEIDRKVRVRVIAATNRDVYSMARTGRFRSDLLYRLLRGSLIRTPSLRDHPEDIPVLAQYLWLKISHPDKIRRPLPDEIIIAIQNYRWPGNVRELSSVLCGLDSYFGDNDLGIKHLTYIFKIQGQMNETGDLLPSPSVVSNNPPACLRHLKHADGSIRSIQVLLEPLLNDQQSLVGGLTTLPYHIHELEILIRQPLLFSDETTFASVNQLKGGLDYFHSLIKEEQTTHAQQLLLTKLMPQLEATMKILLSTAATLIN